MVKPQVDAKLTELLTSGEFTLSAEIMPPRNGKSIQSVYKQIETLLSAGAQYLAVTKGAGGSLRAGSLPIAQAIKNQFQIPCVAHFTCRDLLPEEVENQLIDHHFFGIRNILALRGDPPEGGTDWKPREGSYAYAYQLVEQIRKLNKGKYLERKGFKPEIKEPTDFCIGVACYPDHPIEKERHEFFKRKVDAGAEFGISQMLFDADSYGKFVDKNASLSVPILPGTRLIKSQEQAHRMSKKFQVPLSKSFLKCLPETDDKANPEQTLKAFFQLTENLKKQGAHGIHIFVLTDTELAAQALECLQNAAKPVDRLH